jgi:preprotein translocase subunit Sec61beta
MANDISLPSGFGGLMRYKEEYNSKFKFSPGVVIAMIIITIIFVIGLNLFL